MGFKRKAAVVLLLSWMVSPVSPLSNAVPPYFKTATGQGSTLLPVATHVTASATAAAASTLERLLLPGYPCCNDQGRRTLDGRSRGQSVTALNSGQRESEGPPTAAAEGDGRDHTPASGATTVATSVSNGNGGRRRWQGRQQQEDDLRTVERVEAGWQEEREEEEDDEEEEQEQEQAMPTVTARLRDVVDQLQGELQVGATPQVQSRMELDGLFAELRAKQQGRDGAADTLLTTGGGGGSNSTAGKAAVAMAAATAPPPPPAAAGPVVAPEHRRRWQQPQPQRQAQAQSLSGSAARPPGRPEALTEGSHDLESLSEMLDRVQTSARTHALEEARFRSMALLSTAGLGAGAIGDDPNRSWVAIGNQRDMKTRFRKIREGRVGWAVLPLLMKAKKAGVPLSTGVYNAAIAAYSGTPRKYKDALRVLNMLRSEKDPGVQPDLGSYNSAMWVCSEAGQWRLVMELMAQARQEGIEPDTTSYNCAMKGMAVSRQWARARRLLRRMVSERVVSPDVRTYNGLLEAAGMGSPSPRQHMIEVVHEMEQAGVEPNSYTYTLLLECLARRRKTHDGFQVMARLVDARVPLTPLGHRAGLKFCESYGDWRRAMVLMEDMRVAKHRPSGYLYLLAVKACAKGGQWERALSLMVERCSLDAREEREANEKGSARPPSPRRAEAEAKAKRRAAKTNMETLEAVLSAVSEAGQFEVAIRLVQQMRSAGYTPSKECYVYTLRAAAKWGRWDVIEGLMQDMRALGVGVADDATPPEETENVANGAESGGGGGASGDSRSRVRLSSDCYAPLVEAYAQCSMWERAIEAYKEGFAVCPERLTVEPVNYRVYECVLKACVGAADGLTALEVLRRQVAEPLLLQRLPPSPLSPPHTALAIGDGGGGRLEEEAAAAAAAAAVETDVSGGPPDRRCWSLAAEALGRAGMVDEGHRILMEMVISGLPLRESTKGDVPSLLPLPTAAEDGFQWHQRRRRRPPPRRHGLLSRRRRRQQGTPPSSSSLSSSLRLGFWTPEMEGKETREMLGPPRPPFSSSLSASSLPSSIYSSWKNTGSSLAGRQGEAGDDDHDGGGLAGPAGASPSKFFLDGLEYPKGVVNGEGCTAAAVAARTTGAKMPRVGSLLANDLTAELERRATEEAVGGLPALERKRRRMRAFSRSRREQQSKLQRIRGQGDNGEMRIVVDRLAPAGGGIVVDGDVSRSGRWGGGWGGGGGTAAASAAAAAAGVAQIDLRPGGRRGRDEAFTLRMRARRTNLGVLRSAGAGGVVRGVFGRSRRRRNRDGGRPLDEAASGRRRYCGEGSGVGGDVSDVA